MWFLFQGVIIFVVVASNIRWQWTPNGYLASLIGVGLAYGLTVALDGLWRLAQRRLRREMRDSDQPAKRMGGPR